MRKNYEIALLRNGKSEPSRLRFPSDAWPKVSDVVAWYKRLKFDDGVKSVVKVPEPPGGTRALPLITGGSKLSNSFLISNRLPTLYFASPAGSERGASVSTKVTATSPGIKSQQVYWAVIASTLEAPTSSTWYDERNGSELSDFRQRIRDGLNATTPMEAHRSTIRLVPGFATCTWEQRFPSVEPGVYTDTITGCLPVYGFPPKKQVDSALLSVCDTQALAKLHDRLAELQRTADVGETLAEFGQTLSMLKRPAAGMQDLYEAWYKKAIRLDCSSVPALVKALGKLQLEYSFGWKPLVLDAMAAVEAITKSRDNIRKSLKVSYKGTKNVSKPGVGIISRSSYFRWKSLSLDDLTCTVRYQVGLRPDAIATPTYMEELGLSFDRALPTVYALMPYSWTVDYFTGLNATIDALCADISFLMWTCKTTRWERKQFYSETLDPALMKPGPGTPYRNIAGEPFVREVKRFDVSREIPKTLIPFPTLRVPDSMKPYVNLASLFASRLTIQRTKTSSGSRWKLRPLGGNTPRFI